MYSHFRRGPAESPSQPHCCPCWAQLGDRKSDKVSQGPSSGSSPGTRLKKIRTTYQTNILFLWSILALLNQHYLQLGCENGVHYSASVRPESVVCTEHNQHLFAKLHISSHRDAKGGGAAKKNLKHKYRCLRKPVKGTKICVWTPVFEFLMSPFCLGARTWRPRALILWK